MASSTADSPDALSNDAAPRFDVDDASLRQGMAYALGYAVFVLALTTGAIWVWPRISPWFWAHF